MSSLIVLNSLINNTSQSPTISEDNYANSIRACVVRDASASSLPPSFVKLMDELMGEVIDVSLAQNGDIVGRCVAILRSIVEFVQTEKKKEEQEHERKERAKQEKSGGQDVGDYAMADVVEHNNNAMDMGEDSEEDEGEEDEEEQEGENEGEQVEDEEEDEEEEEMFEEGEEDEEDEEDEGMEGGDEEIQLQRQDADNHDLFDEDDIDSAEE